MSVHSESKSNISQITDNFVEKVNDFVYFYLMRRRSIRWQLWLQ